MAFKLLKENVFSRKVRVAVPVNGGHQDETINVRFRELSVSQVEQFDTSTKEGTNELLRAVVVEITDIVGDDGEALSWNDELRDRMIDVFCVRKALVDDYFKAVAKARGGN